MTKYLFSTFFGKFCLELEMRSSPFTSTSEAVQKAF